MYQKIILSVLAAIIFLAAMRKDKKNSRPLLSGTWIEDSGEALRRRLTFVAPNLMYLHHPHTGLSQTYLYELNAQAGRLRLLQGPEPFGPAEGYPIQFNDRHDLLTIQGLDGEALEASHFKKQS
jgi:hypothetical protein